MLKDHQLLLLSIILLGFQSYASAGVNVTAEVVSVIQITGEMPAQVRANQVFDVNLKFFNNADRELFNISIRETIPAGYKIRSERRISPVPSYIGNESGATVIYWNFSRFSNNTNISLLYSISAPKSTGSYNFRRDAFAFDTLNNSFNAYDTTEQAVLKKSLFTSILEFLGFQ